MALSWRLIALVVALPILGGVACPSSCYCDEDSNSVSCVGDGVSPIPHDIPQQAARLELRNYNVTALPSEQLEGLGNLRQLELQQTRTQSIDDGTFADLDKLERLDLSQNLLQQLTVATFQGLVKLRFLDISSNLLVNISKGFVDLGNLEHLNLRDNRISLLTTDCFTGLQKIQYLNLDSNRITYIEVGTFQYLINLAHLIISNNPLTTLSRLDFFGARLQFMDISNVGLVRVPQSLTKFVRDLRLAKNNLTHISAGDFDSYPYLGLLVLDDNCIGEIENDALGRQEYLVRLWLNGNCLTNVPRNLPTSLQALYMEENKLTDIFSYSFRGLVHLEQLFLQRNEIRKVSFCAFCDLVSLKTLDLQANLIENLTEGVFANLSQLEMLDISQNKLKVIEAHSFDGLVRLKTLQMSRVATPVKLDESSFDYLKSLQVLEVYDSSNLVHQILNSTRLLHGLRRLQEFNIMHNRVVKLRSDFPSFFPNLKSIKMSGNLWHCDRDVLWLAAWIRQLGVQFHSSYSIRCSTPAKLQFRPLMMLSERDVEDATATVTTIEGLSESQTSPFLMDNPVPPTTSTVPFSLVSFSAVLSTMASTSSSSSSSSPSSSSSSSSTSTASSSTTTAVVDTTEADSQSSSTPPSATTPSVDSVEWTSHQPAEPERLSTLPPPADTASQDPTAGMSTKKPTSARRNVSAPKSTSKRLKSASQVEQEERIQTIPQRRVSSRLTGRQEDSSVTSRWEQTTAIVVSATLAGGCALLVVGIFTLFTLVRCKRRYRPMKHRPMRRSSSISYYPQQDEVSIMTLTEGTVGLRTHSHHGLGNKLYYIMESGDTTGDPLKDSLPDPQLQELLPRDGADAGHLSSNFDIK